MMGQYFCFFCWLNLKGLYSSSKGQIQSFTCFLWFMVFDISDFIALLNSSANSDCLYLLLIGRKVYSTNIIYEISSKKFSKRVILRYGRFLPLNKSHQFLSIKRYQWENDKYLCFSLYPHNQYYFPSALLYLSVNVILIVPYILP